MLAAAAGYHGCAVPGLAGHVGEMAGRPGDGRAVGGVMTGRAAVVSHRSRGLLPGPDVFAVPGRPIYPPVTAPQFKIDWWQLA
jgi:hypothetical protein